MNRLKMSDQKVPLQNSHEACSPFHMFIIKSKNMPHIWENIVLNLSATDVAKCLKVCVKLRRIIVQCLKANANLSERLNELATTSALKKALIQKVDFPVGPESQEYNVILSLDGFLLLQLTPNAGEIMNLLQIDIKSGVRVKMSFTEEQIDSDAFFGIYSSCISDEHVFVSDGDGMNLCKINYDGFKMIPNSFFGEDTLYRNDSWKCKEIKPWGYGSNCILYRLFSFKKKQDNNKSGLDMKIVMKSIAGGSGLQKIRSKSMVLYEYEAAGWDSWVKHLPSNEEAKFVVMLPHSMAVHDAITGEVLWSRKHNIRNGWMCELIFITKDVTGYFDYDYPDTPPTGTEGRTVQLFDTKKGDLIGRKQITYKMHTCLKQEARGPLICYQDGLAIHLIKTSGKDVTTCRFDFPVEHFIKTKCLENSKKPSDFSHVVLEGFVSKSNLLVGNLKASSGINHPELFCLDLDAAISARSEEEMNTAFYLPLQHEKRPENEQHMVYQPMYRTDRKKGCVDLVGVVKKIVNLSDRDCIILRTHIFVRKMKYSDV